MGFGGIGSYMDYGTVFESGGKAFSSSVSAAQPAAQAGAASAQALPTEPAELKADLDKLDQHLPKADPNKPYTTEDVANALRDPETGKPVHANGKPASEQDVKVLTELSNNPAKREGFFAAYQKHYDAAVSESDAQKQKQLISNFTKALPDLLKSVGAAITAKGKEDRERDAIDNIVPKMQARLAARPMQPN